MEGFPRFLRCLALALALALALGVVAAARAADEVVQVVVHPEAAAGELVSVGDVANLEGGNPALRRKIAALDLVDLRHPDLEATVLKQMIFYRIQLAGVEPGQFDVQGAEQVHVHRKEQQLTEKDLEAAARRCLAQHLPWPLENVQIRLAQPIQLPSLEHSPEASVRLEGELSPGASLVGHVRIEVVVFINDDPCVAIPVILNVRPFQQVAIASCRLDRGDLLSDKNVRADRRAVENANFLTVEKAAGKRVRRTLLPGQAINSTDVEQAISENPVLVKIQDQVKLVCRVGNFQVTNVGEALQEGRSGQMINVRVSFVDLNDKPKTKIIRGRVVERSLVEVE